MACATSGEAARWVSWSAASRTSVFSLNMMVAPARTSRSAAKPTAGLAVTPEKASLPPHCTPTTRALAGRVWRRRALSRSRCGRALCTMLSSMDMNPTWCSSCRQTVSAGSLAEPPLMMGKLPGGNRREGCSFSQPRLTTMISPPKLGLRLILRNVRIGIMASGASMATPQPYVCSRPTTSSTKGYRGISSVLMRLTA